MDLELNEDQKAIVAGIEQIVAAHPLTMAHKAANWQRDREFEADLAASGFLDVLRTEGLGVMDALLVIEGIARSPFAVETVGTVLVMPAMGGARTCGSIALIGHPHNAPVRFLGDADITLIDAGERIYLARGAELAVTAVQTNYAYPMARTALAGLQDIGVAQTIDPAEFRRLWRLGIVAEMVGAMQASLDIVVDHVKVRKQFGQPLGALQAIQHRLAECAVLVAGTRLLMYEAAAQQSGEGAALAACYAQEAAGRLAYDTMQFHGAMGLTLEYPLHYWAYRLRVLAGELQGPGGNGVAAADQAWVGSKPVAEAFRGQEA